MLKISVYLPTAWLSSCWQVDLYNKARRFEEYFGESDSLKKKAL